MPAGLQRRPLTLRAHTSRYGAPCMIMLTVIWTTRTAGRRAVIRGIFAISAAQQNRCRLDIQPPGLNIYASQSRMENARTCRMALVGKWGSGRPVPRWCRVEIGPDSGLVAEEDGPACGFGRCVDSRVFLRFPAAHPFRILLVSTHEWPLRRQPQVAQDIPDRSRSPVRQLLLGRPGAGNADRAGPRDPGQRWTR